jgi:hypothetical protein
LTDEQVKVLGDLVVARFEELCAEAGDLSIWWSPRTSEVIGECMGETTAECHWSTHVYDVDLDLDALREQAHEEVWQAVVESTGPMAEQVRAIFNREMTVTEAVAEYKVPRASITWAIRQGHLAAQKNGRAWMFMSSDFEDWLENRPGRGRHK